MLLLTSGCISCHLDVRCKSRWLLIVFDVLDDFTKLVPEQVFASLLQGRVKRKISKIEKKSPPVQETRQHASPLQKYPHLIADNVDVLDPGFNN